MAAAVLHGGHTVAAVLPAPAGLPIMVPLTCPPVACLAVFVAWRADGVGSR